MAYRLAKRAETDLADIAYDIIKESISRLKIGIVHSLPGDPSTRNMQLFSDVLDYGASLSFEHVSTKDGCLPSAVTG